MRRFVIGAPDAVIGSLTVPLLQRIGLHAPHVNIGLLHLMPSQPEAADHPWHASLVKLEKRDIEVAVLPLRVVPPRFEARRLYVEDFVVAMRKGHPFARSPTMAAFCGLRHLLASLDGDPRGFVDDLLAKHGRTRRIA